MKKLDIHLRDSLRFDGSVVDFRIYDGSNFSKILKIVGPYHRKCYGIDTFCGLNEPSTIDRKHPNYNEIRKGQYAHSYDLTKKYLANSENRNYFILKTNHYNDLESIIPPDETFCFALVDVKQYAATKKVLEYVWNKISYGGTIYIANYNESLNYAEHEAVKEFIKDVWFEIDISRQMVIDGVKEKFLAIKCYPNKNKPKNWEEIQPKKSKVTIAMVLKTGGAVYDHQYVNALAKSIKENVSIPHELVCLTDDPKGFSQDVDKVIKLTNNYPTWWSKIELFKPNQFDTDTVFYMDLDTVVVGNIDKIVSYDGQFCGLRDFFALHSLGSGIMAWNPKYTENIYLKFTQNSTQIIRNYKEGDQRWIDENKPSIEYIQDIFPNQIVSFKKHCMKNDGKVIVPETAKIICFHGNPRPHTMKHLDFMKHWR